MNRSEGQWQKEGPYDLKEGNRGRAANPVRVARLTFMAAAAFAVLALAAAAGASNPQIAGPRSPCASTALPRAGRRGPRAEDGSSGSRVPAEARAHGRRSGRTANTGSLGLARATLFGTRTSGAACAAVTSACCSSCSGGTAFGQAPSTGAWREDRRGSAPVPAARRPTPDGVVGPRTARRLCSLRVRLARDPLAGKGEEAHASHRTRRDAHRDLPPLRSQRQGDRARAKPARPAPVHHRRGTNPHSRRSCAPAMTESLYRARRDRPLVAGLRCRSAPRPGARVVGVRVQQRSSHPGRAASCR